MRVVEATRIGASGHYNKKLIPLFVLLGGRDEWSRQAQAEAEAQAREREGEAIHERHETDFLSEENAPLQLSQLPAMALSLNKREAKLDE